MSLIPPIKVIVAGKGGSGKSTIVTLMAKLAVKKGLHVIVVDADESNPGIERKLLLNVSNQALMDAIGGRQHAFGMIKDTSSETLQATVNSVMEEAKDEDLFIIQVGKIREAGSGCACPHGMISREILSYPFKSGTFVVVDAEAGVEHFGRGIDEKADVIIFIVDPSHDSIKLCEEAKRLAESIDVRFHVVLNKVDSEYVTSFMKAELAKKSIGVEIIIPYDSSIFMSDMLGKNLKVGEAEEYVEKLLSLILTS